MPLQAGDRVGRYQIRSLIGAGGMGEVYLAHDPQLNREVAVKMLTGETADDAGLRQRFEVEARAASTINHPNIVAVFDYGEHMSLLYIVWELVRGKTLRDVKFTGRQTAEFGAQIADGLAAAHAAGIIHRDLKPENILISTDGRAKILDFGLAKRTGGFSGAFGDVAAHVTQSQPGMMMGTIGYMSPEQIRAKDVDARSDIFSLGLVLYEMVAGHRAFPGDSAVAVLNGLLTLDPADLGPEVPIALRQIITHCIEKNPEMRYQSARDLAFALHSLTSIAVNTSGVHLTLREPTVPLYKRREVWVGLAGLATTAGAFLAGKSLSAPPQTAEVSFQPLTFERGFLSNARFAPDGRSVIYSGAWRGGPLDVFKTPIEQPDPKPMGLASAQLFSVSPGGELAIGTETHRESAALIGTMERVTREGTRSPSKDDIAEAEWDPKSGSLAVVRAAADSSKLEFPPGKVIYESRGRLQRPRFAPDGSKIAFVETAIAGDGKATLVLLDLASGARTTLAARGSIRGLAWVPSGQEVWFGASSGGPARNIEAVDLAGKSRLVLASPSGISVEDIAKDGRVLVTRVDTSNEMSAYRGADQKGTSLAWLDGSIPCALSPDGSILLFTETGEGTGGGSAVCIRRTDGSGPVTKLGEGMACDLSPDGKRVLALVRGSQPRYAIYSAAGDPPARIPVAVTHAGRALFHPDEKRFIFEGGMGQGNQLFAQDLSNGQARSFSSPGVVITGRALSPDNQFVVATGVDGRLAKYLVEGGAERPVQGAKVNDRLIQWSSDAKSLFVCNPNPMLPVRVERLDPATGKRDVVKELTASDLSAIVNFDMVMTPDLGTAVLGFTRQLSVLHLVRGLK